MILTEVFGNVADIDDIDSYHVETCMVKSEDLAKRILRVTSDHGQDYGIRLDDASDPLSNGAVFLKEPGKLVALSVIPDEMIVVTPEGIDEMGIIAHFLGNLHKPVQVKDATIALLYDPVVEKALQQQGIAFEVKELELDAPLKYVDMAEAR